MAKRRNKKYDLIAPVLILVIGAMLFFVFLYGLLGVNSVKNNGVMVAAEITKIEVDSSYGIKRHKSRDIDVYVSYTAPDGTKKENVRTGMYTADMKVGDMLMLTVNPETGGFYVEDEDISRYILMFIPTAFIILGAVVLIKGIWGNVSKKPAAARIKKIGEKYGDLVLSVSIESPFKDSMIFHDEKITPETADYINANGIKELGVMVYKNESFTFDDGNIK